MAKILVKYTNVYLTLFKECALDVSSVDYIINALFQCTHGKFRTLACPELCFSPHGNIGLVVLLPDV